MKSLSSSLQIDIPLAFSRLLVGGLFLFSGFVKAVDPLGTAYKIDDYLIEMGLSTLMVLSLPLSLVMVVGEFTLGMLLLLGVWRKGTLRLIALFLLFFTPLSLWIALTNPVEDCGCFGDAFHISNWDTFYKNLLLLAAMLLLYMKQGKITPLYGGGVAPFVAGFILLFGLLFALHNLNRLPLFDFRPYHIGASIPKQMEVDPALADIYETVFIYQKGGVEREFTEDDYPWNDSTWIFVDMRSRLSQEGVKPAIEDFAVMALTRDDEDGTLIAGSEITMELLQDPGWQFLMIASSLEEMSMGHLDRFLAMERFASRRGYPFYLLTASSPDRVAAWEEQYRSGFRFAIADERVLKTMIRSNPGLMLLNEGVVVNKWDDSQVPLPLADGVDFETSGLVKQHNRLLTNGSRLLLVVFLLLIPLLFMKWFERRRSPSH